MTLVKGNQEAIQVQNIKYERANLIPFAPETIIINMMIGDIAMYTTRRRFDVPVEKRWNILASPAL